MSWSKSLMDFADDQEKRLTADLRARSLQALAGVTERSPVRSGRFRGNHQVTVGEETTDTVDREDASGRETLADGRRVIDGVDKPFTYIVIQNNLPYADEIEGGSSQQAPQGVYAATFEGLA